MAYTIWSNLTSYVSFCSYYQWGEKTSVVGCIYIDFYAVKYELSLMGSQNIGQIPWNTNAYLIVFIASVFGWTETKLKEINCFKVYKTYSFSHKSPLYAILGIRV